MGALAALGTIGNAGAAVGENKVEQQKAQFLAQQQAAELQTRLAEFKQRQQMQALQAQVAQRTLQRGKFGPTQVVKAPDGNWYSVSTNLDTGEEVRKPLGGTPLSNTNVSDRDDAADQRQKDRMAEQFRQRKELQDRAAKYAEDRTKLAAHLRAAQQAKSATDPSLMIMRRYKVLGGDTVSQRIAVLSGKLASMEKNAIGADPSQYYPSYNAERQELADLYRKHDEIMAQSTSAQQQAAAPAAALKKSSGPIQVTTEDLSK